MIPGLTITLHLLPFLRIEVVILKLIINYCLDVQQNFFPTLKKSRISAILYARQGYVFFFICYLAAAPPTLGHYGGNRLIYQFLCSQEPSVIWASNLSNLSYPASNYKVNNRNATARCQICSH